MVLSSNETMEKIFAKKKGIRRLKFLQNYELKKNEFFMNFKRKMRVF